jgi:peptidoglycan/LPS O-acetylase OafA/YrhL
MLDSNPKSMGTRYTTTVGLLIMAFIICPAVLIASRPVGYIPLFLAIACGGLCVILAWVNWKRSSRLTIPSIAIQDARAK